MMPRSFAVVVLPLFVSACSSDHHAGSGVDAGAAGGSSGAATADTSGGAPSTGGAGGAKAGSGGSVVSSGGGTSGGSTSAGGTLGAGGSTGGTSAHAGGASGAATGGTNDSGGASGGDGGVAATTEALYVSGAATNGNGSVITEYDVQLTAPITVTKGPSLAVDGLASFLAFSPSGDRLYATDENNGMLRSFKLDAMTGAPTVLNAVQTAGHPTHVAIEPGNHFAFGADYNEGKVEVVGLDQTGALTSGVDSETPGSQTHEVVFSPDAKFAFVPCKGSDKVAQFKFNGATGALDANTPPSVASAGGAGPRHMAFGPGAAFAYVIDEVGNTMETMAYDKAAGVFTRKGAVTTLPSGFSGSSTAAEVAVSPSGRFVYGSNRIVNANGDIVIFSIGQDGSLTLVGHESTRGIQPRHFSIDPTGTLLFVANLDSKTLVVFSIDATSGKLAFVTQMDAGMQPYYAGVKPAK